MLYRDFIIEPNGLTGGFQAVHKDYDGPEDNRAFTADTPEQCVELVDDYEFDRTFDAMVDELAGQAQNGEVAARIRKRAAEPGHVLNAFLASKAEAALKSAGKDS